MKKIYYFSLLKRKKLNTSSHPESIKVSKIYIVLYVLFSTGFLFCQEYKTNNKVYIPKGLVIKKKQTAKKCIEKLTKNTILKQEEVKNSDGKTYTVIKLDTVQKDTMIAFDRAHILSIKDFSGWVNIKSDANDKSKLNINPLLGIKQKIDSGTIVNRISQIITCKGDYERTSKKDTLEQDEYYNYKRINKEDFIFSKSDWYTSSKNIIEVYKDQNIDHYLINNFDQNADFYIKLDNRSYLNLKEESIVFGPIIIPFKYRFGHTKNGVDISADFSADFNAGLFGGKSWGRYRVKYESDELKKLSNLSLTVGIFLSLSATTFDEDSTTSAKVPLTEDESETRASLSPGIGIMTSIYNFNFGLFGGFEVGFGSIAEKWDYNKRPWIGFGVGYNISNTFFK
ncbi:hypothetical protein BSU00_00120 [Tenacibaculum sp. SG-28]|nr:hypothetical protein BSU00_00120 [Tenacibaculum sp. SG-28]